MCPCLFLYIFLLLSLFSRCLCRFCSSITQKRSGWHSFLRHLCGKRGSSACRVHSLCSPAEQSTRRDTKGQLQGDVRMHHLDTMVALRSQLLYSFRATEVNAWEKTVTSLCALSCVPDSWRQSKNVCLGRGRTKNICPKRSSLAMLTI